MTTTPCVLCCGRKTVSDVDNLEVKTVICPRCRGVGEEQEPELITVETLALRVCCSVELKDPVTNRDLYVVRQTIQHLAKQMLLKGVRE